MVVRGTKGNIVEAVGLTKVFSDFWFRAKARAVDGIDFEIRPNEIFGLLGPNGSGKSTLANVLAGREEQHERQPDEHHLRRRRLGPKSGPQQRQHHHRRLRAVRRGAVPERDQRCVLRGLRAQHVPGISRRSLRTYQVA